MVKAHNIFKKLILGKFVVREFSLVPETIYSIIKGTFNTVLILYCIISKYEERHSNICLKLNAIFCLYLKGSTPVGHVNLIFHKLNVNFPPWCHLKDNEISIANHLARVENIFQFS